jgi:hypothetical protein
MLNALMKPLNERHFLVNMGYFVWTVLILIIQLCSYKSKRASILVMPALMMIHIRQSIRLLDFEQTKPCFYCSEDEQKDGTMDMQSWISLVIIQQHAI